MGPRYIRNLMMAPVLDELWLRLQEITTWRSEAYLPHARTYTMQLMDAFMEDWHQLPTVKGPHDVFSQSIHEHVSCFCED